MVLVGGVSRRRFYWLEVSSKGSSLKRFYIYMRAADFLVRIGHLMEEHHRDFLEIIVYYFMGHDSCSSKLRSLVLMPFFLFSFSPLQMVIYYYWI